MTFWHTDGYFVSSAKRFAAKLVFLAVLLQSAFVCADLNSSIFTQEKLPSNLTVLSGTEVPVTVSVKNTGNTSWTAGGGYRLVAGDRSWSPSFVDVPGIVGPGGEIEFSFKTRAPIYPGVYTLQWQMSQGPDNLFGFQSQAVTINVLQNWEVGLNGFYEHELIVNELVPFADSLDLVTVILTGRTKDGIETFEVVRPFWDGYVDYQRTRFRFRFSPKLEGDWTWHVTTPGLLGFSSETSGAFRVDAALPAAGVCDIKVKQNDRHKFQCEDGTPFFLMGDTSWQFTTNDLAYPTAFQSYIDIRSDQRFNYLHGLAYRYSDHAPPDEPVSEVNGSSNHPFPDYNFNNPNPAYWAEVDQRIAYINTPGNRNGLVAGIFPGWGTQLNCFPVCSNACQGQECNDHPFGNSTQLMNYVRWLARRYRAYRVVWIAGANIHLATETPCAGITSWAQIAEAIACEDDPDGECDIDRIPAHLLTIHPNGGHSLSRWPNQSWNELTYMQGRDPSVATAAYLATNNGRNQPAINGEYHYETQPACWDCIESLGDRRSCDPPCGTSSGSCTEDPQPNSGGSCICDPGCQDNYHSDKEIVRNATWQNYMRGVYTVYGNTATFWHLVRHNVCRAEVNSPGAGYMTYLYSFFNNNPYKDVIWDDPEFQPIEASSSATKRVSGKPGSQYIFYSEETSGTFSHNDSSRIYEWRRYQTNADPNANTSWSPPLNDPVPNYSCNTNQIPAIGSTAVLATGFDPLQCPADTISLATGSSTSVTCTIKRIDPCFSGEIDMLPVADVPPGVSIEFDTPVITNGDSDVVITFTASTDASPGDHNITLRAAGSSFTANLNLSVMIRGLSCETFSAPQVPPNWIFEPSSAWTINGSDLTGTAAPAGARPRKISAYSPSFWNCSNCTIEAEFSFLEDRERAELISVLGWYEDRSNYVELRFKKSEDSRKPDAVKLFRKIAGRKVEIAKAKIAPPGLQFGAAYRLELSFDGTEFRANVYDSSQMLAAPVLVLNKAAVAAPVSSAPVALRVKNTAAAFSFLTICQGCSASEITIGNFSDLETGPGESSTFSFPINLLYGPSCVDRTLIFQSADGTASSENSDYQNVYVTRTIPAGSSSAENVDVIVNGDNVCETDETFFLNQVNSTIRQPASATGIILNDDACASSGVREGL